MIPFASSLAGPFGEAFPCIDGIKKEGMCLNRRSKQIHLQFWCAGNIHGSNYV